MLGIDVSAPIVKLYGYGTFASVAYLVFGCVAQTPPSLSQDAVLIVTLW